MSILYRMEQAQAAAKEAATQTQPQNLSADVKALVQQAGQALANNGVTQAKEVEAIKPDKTPKQEPVQGY